ncbi:MAG: aminotransferase class I/II-fold pyridoxal phosphate-dependent enzyme [Actinomycetota bacterium]|nr:aminotransferase class I/II-fold pyridoxal phosphate-dependent enzyme [Actinomycetota bacterium]
MRTRRRARSRPEITPFHVMEVMKAAERREAAGGDVLHLEVGQPATPAPAGVRQAAIEAIGNDRLAYTAATGIAPLRERIAEHYAASYGVAVSPDRIVVTVGASGACVLSFLAAFGPGARVAVTEPGYPCYRNMLAAFDIEVVGVPVGPDTGYRLTPEHLEAAGNLDGVVVASPSNPTGTTLDPGELDALADWCRRHEVRLVADEIYHGITYGRPITTALASDSSAITIGSFSKYFSMTGWRLGWLVVPDDLLGPVERLAQNLFISPPTLSQLAACAAFDCTDELDEHVRRYEANRKVLVEGLPKAGFANLAPADGAFYVYADVSEYTDDSQRLCAEWLAGIGIAATPGIDFDPVRGHHHVRFSFAGATEDMTMAVDRLTTWVASH